MAGLPARLLETVRARRVTTAVVLAVSVAMLAWPLLSASWLPFVDYPQHLGTVAAIHGQGDEIWSRYFVVEYSRSQYLLLYVLSDWLAYIFGIEGAARLTVVLGVAGLPLALALYLRENGRDAMLGAVSVAVALHVYVFWGFLNFAAALTIGVLALAAFVRLCTQPTSRHAVLFGLGALATFYTHAQIYGWLALAALGTWIAMTPKLGRQHSLASLWRAALAATPSLIAMFVWIQRSGVVEHGEAGARSGHAAQVADQPARFAPIADTVRGWVGHSFEIYRDGAGIWIAAAFFGVVLIMLALRGTNSPSRNVEAKGKKAEESEAEERDRGDRDRDDKHKEPSSPSTASGAPALRARVLAWMRGEPMAAISTYGPEVVVVTTFALYLFAPVSYRLIEPISHRFLPLALALLCCLGPRVVLRGRTRLALGSLLVALSIFVGVAHHERFTVTDDEMGELAEALEHTEPGGRLMGLIHDQASQVVPFATYLHAHQYYQARVGGMACFSFVEFPKSPVQWAEGAAPPPFSPRFEWTPQRYDHATWGEHFDYWLIRHPPGRPPSNPLRVRPDQPGAPERVFESSRWTLYARPNSGA